MAKKHRSKAERGLSIREELEANEKALAETALAAEEDDEDKLIQYLEKCLGVKDSSKSKALVKKVIAEDFGDDGDLFDLITKDAAVQERKRHRSADKSEDSVSTDETEVAKPDVEQTSARAVERPSPELSKSTPKTAVWVPRRPTASTQSSPKDRCALIIKRGFNRVSDGNLQIISKSMIEELSQIRSDFQISLIGKNDAAARAFQLIEEISKSCSDAVISILHTRAGPTLLSSQLGLLSTLACKFHSRVLHQYLFDLFSEFKKSIQAHKAEAEFDKSLARQCVQALSILTLIHAVDAEFLICFCRWFVSPSVAITSLIKIELLAVIYRDCANDLKRDSNMFYLELKGMIQNIIFEYESGTTKDAGPSSSAILWIKGELQDVDRRPRADGTRKLTALRSKFGIDGLPNVHIMYPDEFLRACMDNDFARGMLAAQGTQEITEPDAVRKSSDNEDAKLREAAKKAHIKSPFQQDIFIGVAKSSDLNQAVSNVMKLIQRSHQLESAVAVILHCVIQERSYNPFYAALANRFCSLPNESWRKKFLKGFQRGLHLLINSDMDILTKDRDLLSKKLMLFLKDFAESLGEDKSSRLSLKLESRHASLESTSCSAFD